MDLSFKTLASKDAPLLLFGDTINLSIFFNVFKH